jgi:hypothetical protein
MNNRATRRILARKGLPEARVCQEGAHVLYSPGNGYLLAANPTRLDFVDGPRAESQAQRFHQECAGLFAAQMKASFGLSLEVRHQAQAEAEGWQ